MHTRGRLLHVLLLLYMFCCKCFSDCGLHARRSNENGWGHLTERLEDFTRTTQVKQSRHFQKQHSFSEKQTFLETCFVLLVARSGSGTGPIDGSLFRRRRGTREVSRICANKVGKHRALLRAVLRGACIMTHRSAHVPEPPSHCYCYLIPARTNQHHTLELICVRLRRKRSEEKSQSFN